MKFALFSTVVVTVLIATCFRYRQIQMARKRTWYAGNKIIYHKDHAREFNMTFTQRSKESDGKSMATYNIMTNTGACAKSVPYKERHCYVPHHYHTKQLETFSIIEGAIEWYIDGKFGRTKKGETL